MTIAIVVGMEAEAEIVRRICPKAVVVIGAGDASLLSSRLNTALGDAAIDRVISVGICGALNPALQVGDVVVGVRVTYELAVASCDQDWCNWMLEALMTPALPFGVTYGSFTWSEKAVTRLADKAVLRTATMCDVVDEETFIALATAAARGLRCAALRVVCDPASFDLSKAPAALVKLEASGADDMGAILASVLGDLEQVPELIQLAGYSEKAMANLETALTRVSSGFVATPSLN